MSNPIELAVKKSRSARTARIEILLGPQVQGIGIVAVRKDRED